MPGRERQRPGRGEAESPWPRTRRRGLPWRAAIGTRRPRTERAEGGPRGENVKPHDSTAGGVGMLCNRGVSSGGVSYVLSRWRQTPV